MLEQLCSSQRYVSTKAGKAAALVKRMVALSRENPRLGYRRIWALLNREGWEVNKKRIQRLWREAGLKVPTSRERKRSRLGISENGCTRRRAEYSRECLALDTERSITAEGVVEILDRLYRAGRVSLHSLGKWPWLHGRGDKALACGFRGEDPLHQTRCSVGERLLKETFITRLQSSYLTGRCLPI
jgi:hypothetical protein